MTFHDIQGSNNLAQNDGHENESPPIQADLPVVGFEPRIDVCLPLLASPVTFLIIIILDSFRNRCEPARTVMPRGLPHYHS